MAYVPLFKKIHVEPVTSDKIGNLQHDFERFWLPINKGLVSNAEKTLGMRKMQEACMWLSRSIAAQGDAPKASKAATSVCPPSNVE